MTSAMPETTPVTEMGIDTVEHVARAIYAEQGTGRSFESIRHTSMGYQIFKYANAAIAALSTRTPEAAQVEELKAENKRLIKQFAALATRSIMQGGEMFELLRTIAEYRLVLKDPEEVGGDVAGYYKLIAETWRAAAKRVVDKHTADDTALAQVRHPLEKEG